MGLGDSGDEVQRWGVDGDACRAAGGNAWRGCQSSANPVEKWAQVTRERRCKDRGLEVMRGSEPEKMSGGQGRRGAEMGVDGFFSFFYQVYKSFFKSLHIAIYFILHKSSKSISFLSFASLVIGKNEKLVMIGKKGKRSLQ